jgi:hypothetical protein
MARVFRSIDEPINSRIGPDFPPDSHQDEGKSMSKRQARILTTFACVLALAAACAPPVETQDDGDTHTKQERPRDLPDGMNHGGGGGGM